MKCLIIEDSLSNLNLLMKLIKESWKIPEMELEIVGCHSLAAGLAEAHNANVTIIDLNLPDSGRDNTIRSLRLFHPPVIVLTADENPETARECMIHGADHVFFKGSAHGLITSIFETMQKDILRRAIDRQHELAR